MVAFEFQAPLLGIAAILSATGGIISTIWAIRKDRKSERDDCREKLRDVRAEAEKYAEELHRMKMGEFD